MALPVTLLVTTQGPAGVPGVLVCFSPFPSDGCMALPFFPVAFPGVTKVGRWAGLFGQTQF